MDSSGSSQRVFLDRQVRQERRAYLRRLTGCEEVDGDGGGAAAEPEAEGEAEECAPSMVARKSGRPTRPRIGLLCVLRG